MAVTAKQAPFTGPYSVEGYGLHKGNTPLVLKRSMARLGFLTWEPDVWDDVFNVKLETALDRWDGGKDGYAEGRWAKLRAARIPAGLPHAGEPALDTVAQQLLRAEAEASKVKVPALGPVYNGGPSVLQYDLTHETDGIDLYPAFDTAFSSGTGIIAPEPLTVFQASNSAPGNAFYCRGTSKLQWWFGHLDRDQPVGRSFRKGDLIGRVYRQRVSHCHVALNVELLWGTGRELAHHDDYTHGSPLIGDQLREGPL